MPIAGACIAICPLVLNQLLSCRKSAMVGIHRYKAHGIFRHVLYGHSALTVFGMELGEKK